MVHLGCRVSCVTAVRKEVAEGLGARIVASLDDLRSCDAVVVASPEKLHAEHVLRLSDFGLPLYVEKPFATSLDDAERVALQLAGRPVFVMHKWRYHQGILQMRALLEEGLLGEPIALFSKRLAWVSRHRDVGALWFLASHDLSISLELLGGLGEVAAVSGVGAGDDNVYVSFQLRGAVPHFVEVGSRCASSSREITLLCEGGTMTLENADAQAVKVVRASGHTASGPSWVRFDHERMPLEAQLRSFVEFLDGGPPPHSSLEDALQVVRKLSEVDAQLLKMR